MAAGHLEAARATLPDGQLAIVPAPCTASAGKPELASRLIIDFLSDGHAQKFMPGPR